MLGVTGTGRDDADELALLAAELGSDGVFLDTLKQADSRLIARLQEGERPQLLVDWESGVDGDVDPDLEDFCDRLLLQLGAAGQADDDVAVVALRRG